MKVIIYAGWVFLFTFILFNHHLWSQDTTKVFGTWKQIWNEFRNHSFLPFLVQLFSRKNCLSFITKHCSFGMINFLTFMPPWRCDNSSLCFLDLDIVSSFFLEQGWKLQNSQSHAWKHVFLHNPPFLILSLLHHLTNLFLLFFQQLILPLTYQKIFFFILIWSITKTASLKSFSCFGSLPLILAKFNPLTWGIFF